MADGSSEMRWDRPGAAKPAAPIAINHPFFPSPPPPFPLRARAHSQVYVPRGVTATRFL